MNSLLPEDWTETTKQFNSTGRTWEHNEYGMVIRVAFRTFQAYALHGSELGIFESKEAAFARLEKFIKDII
jgi:hypothetical protein